MAEDWKLVPTNESDLPVTEVKTDQLMVILKAHPNSIKGAESYLKNRGWQILSTFKLREALSWIIQKKPHYILVAADHSNPKVKALPALLTQTFSVPVIGFTELSDNRAYGKLMELGLEYNLQPPISGPSVERMLAKIEKDKTSKTQQDFHRLSSQNQDDESTHVRGSAVDAARHALNKLIHESDTDSSDPSLAEQELKDKSGVIIQKGTAGEQINYTPASSAAEASGVAHAQQISSSSAGGNSSPGSTLTAGGATHIGHRSSSPSPSGMNSPGLNPSNSNSADPQFQNGAQGDGFHHNPDANNRDPGSAQQSGQAGSYHSSWDDSAPPTEAKSSSPPIPSHSPSQLGLIIPKPGGKNTSLGGFGDEESIIVRGTQTAIDESVALAGQPLSEKVEEISANSHLACITINSSRFSGYLVAALGKDRKIDDKFMQLIRDRLFAFLRNHGELISEDESPMNLKLEQVEFEGWAMQQAEFLRKSVHGSDELAMAFFPTPDTKINLEASVTENMVKMTMDDLRDNVSVEFDLYIYMPENQKFLLYTQEGQILEGTQKDRLKKRGITHMHLRKEKIGSVKLYKAKNFLNDKIIEFKNSSVNKETR